MKNLPACTQCGSELTYENDGLYICPECGYEWTEKTESENDSPEIFVRDAYGNILKNGDSVTIVKDVKVKGASSALKIGIKVKDIRLVEEVNGHNIEGKVPGFGLMLLKSEIVKKSS